MDPYEPPGHGVGAGALKGQYEPMGHGKHPDAPEKLKVPAGQGVGLTVESGQ